MHIYLNHLSILPDFFICILLYVHVGESLAKPRKPPRPKHKGGSSLKVSIGRRQLSESSSPQESVMTVQVPRSKLKGSLGHSHQRSSLNPMYSDYSTVYGGAPIDVLGNGELCVVPQEFSSEFCFRWSKHLVPTF